MISTVGALIEALGGSKNAGEAFRIGKSAISFWRVENDLPLWARHRAKEIAEASGLVIDPQLVAPKPRVKYGTGKAAREAAKRRRQSRARLRMKIARRRPFASAAE